MLARETAGPMSKEKPNVAWRIGLEDETICDYAGVAMREFYMDPRVMLRARQRARMRSFAANKWWA